MPTLMSIPYPDANTVLMSMLGDIAPTVLRVPNDFVPPLIVVKRVGGQPDVEDTTDQPIMLIAVYGATYSAAVNLMAAVQTRILSSPLTAVDVLDGSNITGRVLVDAAGIHVGVAEVPDVYADDRRIIATFQLAWRRQFPVG